MQYHTIPCNTMQYHAIPCNTMQYNAIPCNTMQCHAIPCIINNCWRSVPLPCGQYNGHFYFQNCRRQSDQLVAFPCFHRFSHLCHSKLPSLQDLICSPLKTIMALFDRPKALSLVWCLRDEWCCQESSTTAWLGARHFQHSDYFTFSDSVYILPALKRSLCSCLFETISNWSN